MAAVRTFNTAGPLRAHRHYQIAPLSRIEREYALGRGRTDLLIVWPQGGRERRYVVECKVRYGDLERTIAEGMAQTRAYVDRGAAEAGQQKIFHREPAPGMDAPVTVWGM